MTNDEILNLVKDYMIQHKIPFVEPGEFGEREGVKQEVIFLNPLGLGGVMDPPDSRFWVDVNNKEVTLIYGMVNPSKFHYLQIVKVVSHEGELSEIYNQKAKIVAMTIEGLDEWHYTIATEGDRRWLVAESALESITDLKNPKNIVDK